MKYPEWTDFAPKSLIPTVVEQTHRGEQGWDIFSRLLKDRIIFLGTPVDDRVANIIIAELLYLEVKIPKRRFRSTSIHRVALSRVGWRYDTMNHVKYPVSTICIGQAASMGAFLLAAGEKGHRFALPMLESWFTSHLAAHKVRQATLKSRRRKFFESATCLIASCLITPANRWTRLFMIRTETIS